MNHPIGRTVLSLLLAAGALTLATCSRAPRLDTWVVNQDDVANFAEVVPGRVYRAGRVTENGYRNLFGQGLKSVINLRTSHDDAEIIPAHHLDSYHRFRIPDHTPPTDEQMSGILDLVRDPDSWPVLIHCGAGKGRAGTVIAVIRYSVQGWPIDEALRESQRFRGGSRLNEADREFVQHWAKSHAPGEWAWADADAIERWHRRTGTRGP